MITPPQFFRAEMVDGVIDVAAARKRGAGAMTILSALTKLYDRMQEIGEASAPGYSTERISFALVLGR